MSSKTYVEYKVVRSLSGLWICNFICDGEIDSDYRGTGVYDSEKKAIAAGKRYIKFMKSYGFYTKGE